MIWFKSSIINNLFKDTMLGMK